MLSQSGDVKQRILMYMFQKQLRGALINTNKPL